MTHASASPFRRNAIAHRGALRRHVRWLRVLCALMPSAGACAAPLITPFDPQTDRPVYDAVRQGDGKLLLAGSFQQARGQPRTCLARFNPDGSLDAGFDVNLRLGSQRCIVASVLVLPDGKLLIGGTFDYVQNQRARYAARLQSNGALDTDFTPAPVGDPLYVTLSAVVRQPDGKLLLAGHFQTVDNQPRKRIVRLLANGSLDPSFGDANANDTISALALQPDGRILIGGHFTSVGGQPRSRVARLNSDGSLDPTFGGPEVDNTVTTLAMQPDGRVLVGGFFELPRPGLLRTASSGAFDASFVPDITGSAYSVAVQGGGKITLTHSTPGISGTLVRLNNDGSSDPDFRYSLCCDDFGLAPRVILQAGGFTTVVGSFQTIAGESRGNAARIYEESVFAYGFE